MWSMRPNIGSGSLCNVARGPNLRGRRAKPNLHIYLFANEQSGGGTDVDELRRRLTGAGATIVDDLGAAERIVIASGDGAIAQAAEEAARRGVPLAVVPSGTANDFARANRIPQDWDE